MTPLMLYDGNLRMNEGIQAVRRKRDDSLATSSTIPEIFVITYASDGSNEVVDSRKSQSSREPDDASASFRRRRVTESLGYVGSGARAVR